MVVAMPRRGEGGRGNDPLITGQIYHLYNRGIGGQITFPDSEAYTYFIQLLAHCKNFTTSLSRHAALVKLYGEEKYRLVEPGNPGGLAAVPVKLHAYVLMPNHFHLLLEYLTDGGITDYVGRVCNSFTKAFNERFKRRGPLWQGRFKAVLVADDQSFLQVSRYLHLNPLHSSHLRVKKLEEYPFSSYLEVIGKESEALCDHSRLRELIPSPKEYKEFVLAGISEPEGKLLEKLVIEQFFTD